MTDEGEAPSQRRERHWPGALGALFVVSVLMGVVCLADALFVGEDPIGGMDQDPGSAPAVLLLFAATPLLVGTLYARRDRIDVPKALLVAGPLVLLQTLLAVHPGLA